MGFRQVDSLEDYVPGSSLSSSCSTLCSFSWASAAESPRGIRPPKAVGPSEG